MMLPRRSPRLEAPPPKRPTKPRQPKRVQDETEDSVRQAQYRTELAAWEAANEEHAQLMKRRQAKQTAAWKTAPKFSRFPDLLSLSVINDFHTSTLAWIL